MTSRPGLSMRKYWNSMTCKGLSEPMKRSLRSSLNNFRPTFPLRSSITSPLFILDSEILPMLKLVTNWRFCSQPVPPFSFAYLQSGLEKALERSKSEQEHDERYYNAISLTTYYNLGRLKESAYLTTEAEQIYKAIIKEYPSYIDCNLHLLTLW